MKKQLFIRLIFSFLVLTWASSLFAQQNLAAKNPARVYGKAVDEKGEAVGYATVQLFSLRPGPTGQQLEEIFLAGQITEDDGDFNLEVTPTDEELLLRISFVGYGEVEKKFSLDPKAIGRQEHNLGTLTLSTAATALQEVIVTAEAASAIMAIDRKIFRVDKNAMAAGGTAEDALRNIPSLAVDIDGNVTMRNAAPQIFVDGRPTTLTLEQIPADAIESVELVTNPSAKYDASGGQAGIINIVLKKEHRIGYSGNVRSGTDTRGGLNFGGDINARDGKFNTFLGANLNQRRSFGNNETDRQNLFGSPLTNTLQQGETSMRGYFAGLRGGLDWFMDDRNTITFTGNFTRGQFNPSEVINIHTDSLFPGFIASSDALRNTSNERVFQNVGGSILYKRLFAKPGQEWTADVNYNRIRNNMEGNFSTLFFDTGLETRQRQLGSGNNNFFTFQTDYVEPLNDKMKLELGARAAMRAFNNINNNFLFDEAGESWVYLPTFTDQYNFEDAVYAAYVAFNHQLPKWGYQLGLRAESSTYSGFLPEANETFSNDFPLSLFPSLFVTRKLNETDNVQFSYTRRINRPNFFQLMPFTDFTDPLNLNQGNPDLLPEFTNSLELSYQNIFKKGHNLLVSAFYKQTNNMITRYQFSEFSEALNEAAIVSSFANSSTGLAYGMEFILRNTFGKNVELTSNLNLFNARVDASNVESNLVNERFSWFIKENLSIRLPKQFTFQINGEYFSAAAFSPVGGGGRFGGGPWGGVTSTAQGFTLSNWFVDLAVRKDFLDRKASLTLSVQDILRTRRFGSFTQSDFFIQDTWRVRDPQVVRLNFSYRFGKMDVSLFKRKHNRMNNDAIDMMQ
jgi:outer membrane receptor protein involved in Fe transport